MIDFGTLLDSSLIHTLLKCTNQSRSIRLTNPKVIVYSLITCRSSKMPPRLVLARLENVGENRFGFGTLDGNERSLLCSDLLTTTDERFSFYYFKMISQNESFKSLVCGL